MIRIGPAGSAGLGNEKGLEKVHCLGLNAMEIEFTYGVKMPDNQAKRLGEKAKGLDVMLSVHCPYYINLASIDKAKVLASKKRILDSCQKAHLLGAKYIVFHAGFYQERNKKETYDIIKKEIRDMREIVKKNKWDVILAPETTGKRTQFGDIDELLMLQKETDCELCVDFSHILAREGTIDYDMVFNKLEGIGHVHAHFSGIEYTAKGEKRHLITEKKDIRPLVSKIVGRGVDITIINESPEPIKDSIKIKETISLVYSDSQ
ncbi:MAG: TIM barrel protein [Candidatus Omnitrophota bacterium]